MGQKCRKYKFITNIRHSYISKWLTPNYNNRLETFHDCLMEGGFLLIKSCFIPILIIKWKDPFVKSKNASGKVK